MWCQFQNKMYPKQSINIVLRVYQQLKRQSYNDATNKVESDKNLKKRTSSYEDGSGERERIVKDSEGEI